MRDSWPAKAAEGRDKADFALVSQGRGPKYSSPKSGEFESILEQVPFGRNEYCLAV